MTQLPRRRAASPAPLLAALIAALITVIATGEARAHSCARTYHVNAQASRVIDDVSRQIDTLERKVVAALHKQTGQQSGYIAQSARAVVGAIDSQTHLQAQIAREAAETRAIQDRRPSRSGCRTLTGLRGLAPARATEEARGRAAGAVEHRRLAAEGADAARDANSARFRHLLATYCHAGSAGADGALCAGTPADHRADLDPARLFDSATLHDETSRDAARELARNLAAPLVSAPVVLTPADTAEERRRVLAARAGEARAALGLDYFTAARARRAPLSGATGEALGRWAAALAPGAAAPAHPPSRHALMETLAERRFEDPDWFVRLQAMNTAALLRELVTLQAISLMLDWRRYRLDERRGAIDAARLAARRDPAGRN